MKKLLLLNLLFATGFAVQGQQTRVSEFAMSDSVVRTIVREYSFPATISYVETKTEHYFLFKDGNPYGISSLRFVPIGTGLYVNDFLIRGDSVFFCGMRSNGGGFFGAYEVNDFFFGTQGYWITGLSMPTVASQVQMLNKMVAYSGNYGADLVAIGKTTLGQDCVVELNRMNPASWHYRVGELPLNSYDNILDITLTADYVITAGVNYLGYPCIRVYNRNDVFSSTYVQDTAIFFFDKLNSYDYVFDKKRALLSTVHGTGLQNCFIFAGNYVFKKQKPPIESDSGIYVGIFLVDPTNISPIVRNLTGGKIKQTYSNAKWRLRGLTSLPATSSTSLPFYLLQDTDAVVPATPLSRVLELSYYILQYGNPVSFRHTLTTQYQSIDGYNGYSEYVMTGMNWTDKRLLTFCERFDPGQNSCMDPSSFPCENLSMEGKPQYNPFTVGDFPMTLSNKTAGQPIAERTRIVCPDPQTIKTDER